MSDSHEEMKERLAAIDAALASGVTTVSVDGTTTTVSLEQLRRERKELRRQLQMIKPVATSWWLG